jgi:arylsulfatase A-like enzyme
MGTDRPNVVMLVTDNQSADSLGCYGSTEHETPRIDRLAREGVRFERAFCTNGLCSPTRASILTGLLPSQHGVHLAIPDDDVVPKADDYDVTRAFRTLPGTLAHHGWCCLPPWWARTRATRSPGTSRAGPSGRSPRWTTD